jgi:steroid 5-alpha reductase family enzyme
VNKNSTLKVKSFLVCTFVYVIALVASLITNKFLPPIMSPLWKAAIVDVVATIVVFLFSVAYRNSSLYDPYWSVAPPFIAFYWMSEFQEQNFAAQTFMLVVISIWAIRLTLNWARGWQGLQHEDWRYKMLHDKNPSLYWFTNFAGIHMFPTVMVFMGMVPVFYFMKQASAISLITEMGAVLALVGVAFEYVADEQLRNFKKTAKPNSFIDSGIWRYSRHPNYFGEVLFWFGLWIMAIGVNVNFWFTAFGWVAMLCMFLFASIPMMEHRNQQHKPGYDLYQKKVSVFFPWFRKQI